MSHHKVEQIIHRIQLARHQVTTIVRNIATHNFHFTIQSLIITTFNFFSYNQSNTYLFDVSLENVERR